MGRYYYYVYIVKMFEIVFSLMLRTSTYFHVSIILDSPITNASVSIRMPCLHKTVNMVVFFVKSNENTYPKCTKLAL